MSKLLVALYLITCGRLQSPKTVDNWIGWSLWAFACRHKGCRGSVVHQEYSQTQALMTFTRSCAKRCIHVHRTKAPVVNNLNTGIFSLRHKTPSSRQACDLIKMMESKLFAFKLLWKCFIYLKFLCILLTSNHFRFKLCTYLGNDRFVCPIKYWIERALGFLTIITHRPQYKSQSKHFKRKQIKNFATAFAWLA